MIYYPQTYQGYGQVPEDYPTQEEVDWATSAAIAASQRADMQAALSAQAQAFNNSLISGFVAAAAFSVVMWGLGQAVLKKG